MICNTNEYRRFTNDYESYDGDVSEALAEAQAEIERLTNRKFEFAEDTTELLEVYGGSVYPSRIPISSSAGTVVGAGIQFGFFDYNYDYPRSSYDQLMTQNRGLVSVTYTGGYEEEDMPVELKKLVAKVARKTLRVPAVDMSRLPAGATSVTVGDMSISGKNLTASEVVDQSIMAELRSWRRPEL